MQSRLERLRPLIAKAEAGVLLVSSPENRRYLSGFTGSAGTVVVAPEHAWLVADFRYWQQATEQAPDFELARLEIPRKVEDVLSDLIADQGWRRVGIEADHLTVETFDTLGEALSKAGAELVKTKGLIAGLRQVKDVDEVRRIQAAVDLTDQAMAHAQTLLRPGVTEAEVAWQVEMYMRTHGAEGIAFPTIVAFGPNSALPHYHAGDRVLQAGEPIVIDMGATVDGYRGDLTRSFCLPPVDPRFAELYSIVLEALETAKRGLHAGLTGKQADSIARDLIAERGFGPEFGHSLGHSLGLEIHEKPALSQRNEDPIAAGTIETVEPGIYLPGWGGVRIEDVVVVEEDSVRTLTGAPR